MNVPQRDRLKIYLDEAKERHTSHWDWDYMARSEIEASLTSRTADTVDEPQRSRNSLLLRIRQLFEHRRS